MSKENSAAVSVDSNVSIKVFNSKRELVQSINKHNKATVVMVEGLLHFLQGWYTPTSYNEQEGGGTPGDAIPYIPVSVGFGNVGVKKGIYPTISPDIEMFQGINSGDFVQPSFTDTKLQKPLTMYGEGILSNFNFSDSELSVYEDLNNSESLRMILKVPQGSLVGMMVASDEDEGSQEFDPYSSAFYDPSTGYWTTLITELGLFSSTGTLLARVLLDAPVSRKEVKDPNTGDVIGYTYRFDEDSEFNPIMADQNTTIIVEWRIGVISVGKNDHFVTDSNIRSADLANQLSDWLVPTYGIPEGQQSVIKSQIDTILQEYDNVTTD